MPKKKWKRIIETKMKIYFLVEKIDRSTCYDVCSHLNYVKPFNNFRQCVSLLFLLFLLWNILTRVQSIHNKNESVKWAKKKKRRKEKYEINERNKNWFSCNVRSHWNKNSKTEIKSNWNDEWHFLSANWRWNEVNENMSNIVDKISRT